MLKHNRFSWIAKTAHRLDDFKWRILHRVHPKYRYHVHKFHKLDPGWHDADYKMLHACFDFLVEFVEKEDGLSTLMLQYTFAERDGEFCLADAEGSMDQEGYEFAKHVYKEARELYDWWKPLSDSDIQALEFEYGPKPQPELCSKQLERLMKIRRYLWT